MNEKILKYKFHDKCGFFLQLKNQQESIFVTFKGHNPYVRSLIKFITNNLFGNRNETHHYVVDPKFLIYYKLPVMMFKSYKDIELHYLDQLSEQSVKLLNILVDNELN